MEVPDFIHDMECTGVAKPCNAVQEGGGAGIDLLGVAFSWENGEFLLLKETSYWTCQTQRSDISLHTFL